jgi:trehalose utilization protein
MNRRAFSLVAIFVLTASLFVPLSFTAATFAAEKGQPTIRVAVWDEQQPAQKGIYPNFLGNYLAEQFRAMPGLSVKSVSLGSPEQGLSADVLDRCDVLVWWGHVRQREVKPEKGREIVRRIKAGKLSLIALHSAHWSTPFVEAMYERARLDALEKVPAADRGKVKFRETYPALTAPKADAPLTPSATVKQLADGTLEIDLTQSVCCFPVYKVEGKASRVKIVAANHPIASGLPAEFTIPQTELYAGAFHVPKPDTVIFEETWSDGETFSSSVWKLGRGSVFYFRPGHETYPIYRQPEVMKMLENAVRWMGAKHSR